MNMPERSSRGQEWREYRHDSGATLPFRFLRSARKTIALYVNRDGSVLVRAPLRVSFAEIFLFMHERWDWLQTQRSRFLEQPVAVPFSYRHGETFLHMGQECMLQVKSGGRNQARMVNGELLVTLTPENLLAEDGLGSVIELWQRREAKRVFPSRLAFCHELMGELRLPFPELKIRKMRARWGSCTRSAQVTLNLELIRMPPECLDYVIVHELCHLVEFNHSPKFYELQARFTPDWKLQRQRLDELARRQYGL